MKLVKENGGHSIGVYNEGEREKVESLLLYDRVDFLAPTDYTENSELDQIVKDIILKMVMLDSLKRKSKEQIASLK
jgi:hypothetical protein